MRALMVGLLLAVPALAADVESGPEKGAKVPALKVFTATGDNEKKTVDYPGTFKEKPTLYFFVNAEKFSRQMNQFMKKIDTKVSEDFKGVKAVAVWLTEDEDKTKKRLAAIQMSVNYEMPLTLFKGKEGPKGWNVNSDAHLTVVLAHKGKVVAKFGYNSVNGEDAPAVLKELKKHAK